ncbi:tripartite tricarboxylate transporter TctB family protein [Clostridium sp. AM58-1XD]|uniref:tripartite tricarboxylate transporter TctB family protein n=1 Tax=Clostridium sp. AM58-1XD TaxID=2292307 RepID=UPI000E4D3202|nr:tripartite tricarboxylate transporter TctB family protein [Clostridium sp. AM58-1XD]RGY95588.1 tripartite tricarboxylate transporter TctB family protein [Clostridium sp. AM58-1XD]
MYLWLGEIIISVLAAFTAVFFFVEAGSFRDLATNQLDIGSRSFPRLIAVLLLLFSFWQIFHAVRRTRPAGEKISFGNLPTVITGMILLSIYILILKKIGYFYATPVFIFLLQMIQGCRKWVTMIIISGCFSLFAYIVFVRFLGVALP